MRDAKEVKKGDFFRRYGQNHKVIGVVEGYVVTRVKGFAPGIHPAKEMVNGKHGWEDLQAESPCKVRDEGADRRR
jgi:hypothetical protein